MSKTERLTTNSLVNAKWRAVLAARKPAVESARLFEGRNFVHVGGFTDAVLVVVNSTSVRVQFTYGLVPHHRPFGRARRRAAPRRSRVTLHASPTALARGAAARAPAPEVLRFKFPHGFALFI